jgi:hypothetical protein
MTIFLEQEIHPTFPVAINHTLDSLEDDWCYENAQFTAYQLTSVFICEGHTHCSSKEGFIITMVKLAMGFATLPNGLN